MSPPQELDKLYLQLLNLDFLEYSYREKNFVFFRLNDCDRNIHNFYSIMIYLGPLQLSGPNICWLRGATWLRNVASFEEVFENSSPEVQEKLIWNLDILLK